MLADRVRMSGPRDNLFMIYDHGVVYEPISRRPASTQTVNFNSDHIDIRYNSDAVGDNSVATVNLIDFSKFKKIFIDWSGGGDDASTRFSRVSISDGRGFVSSNSRVTNLLSIAYNFERRLDEIDISDINEELYLCIYSRTSTSSRRLANTQVYSLWLE